MTILITTGHRPRISRKTGKSNASLIANIPRSRTFKSQDELQEYWAAQLDAVPEVHYVPGIGSEGIFSNALTTQIKQITSLPNAWGWSFGLGYVNFDREYPDFSFGEYESDLSAAVTDGSFNPRAWWKFITDRMNTSLRSIIQLGVQTHQQVIVTTSTQMYPVIAGELAALTSDPDLSIDEIRQCLRLVGADLDSKVPPALLDCVMPYDQADIDRVVPGTTSNRARRIAFLLVKLRPDSTDPIADYKEISAYTSNKSSPILEFKANVRYTKVKARSLSPDELGTVIYDKYYDRCHGIVTRITRMMRHDGYHVTTEQVDGFINGKKPSTKSSEQSGQATAKAAKPATSNAAKTTAKPANKPKAATATKRSAKPATADA